MRKLWWLLAILIGAVCITAVIRHYFSPPEKVRSTIRGIQTTHYPKYVFNSCTGKWAVQTGESKDYGNKVSIAYLGQAVGTFYIDDRPVSEDGDTVAWQVLGSEITFPSREAAVKFYENWPGNLDKIAARKKAEKDSADRIKHIEDSTFQCEHNYQ